MTPGNPDFWNWSFGDGSFSDEQDPVHTYLLPGNFTLNRTVSNATAGNAASISLTDYISVTAPAVAANFTAEPTAGTAPLAVNFTDLSTGSPVSWNWSFGDGKFSAVQNPSYTYLTPVNFTVNLTVDDGFGVNDTLSMQEYVTVTVPFVISNFTANATAGQAPFAVAFSDLSEGFPTRWNWSFGDGSFAEEQHPIHSYVLAGNYTVSLVASNAFSSDNRTVAEYVKVEPAVPAFSTEIIFNSMPTTMFQGEHYIVDIKVNNTGTETWYADPANANLVFLQGLGGPYGDAAKFNITHIPMIFTNETVAPGESYDFFFYVQAPDTIGNYTPEYQVASASGGVFGPVANATVNVIENPFHPVKQPDGSKLYTTTFGNTSSGMSVSVVGPRVYIDKIQASSFNDPRFLINPALKSGAFDFELNDSFSYADVSVNYDPAKVSSPSNLALGYFNESTGNYTFVPSTVDTVNHKVTSRISNTDVLSSGATFGALDAVQYHSLPVQAQNEMGYMDIGPNDNWTIYPPVDSFSTTQFANGANFPPGNYTILASGSYSNINLMNMGCYAGWATADSNPDSWSGMYLVYPDVSGQSETQVQNRRVSSGVLRINNKGGTVGVYNRHYTQGSCGSVGYQMYYGDGPVFRDGEYDFRNELNNDEFNATELGYDIAVTAYQAAAGCVLGQAGQKGGYLDGMHSAIPGWNDYINDDVTESPAYMIGHVACAIAFPEIALARDFTADVLRGDPMAVALDSLGYLGPVKNLLKNSGVLTQFIIKNPESEVRLITDLEKLRMFDDLSYVDKLSMYNEASRGAANRLVTKYGTTPEAMEKVYLGAKQSLERIERFVETPPTMAWADKNGKPGTLLMLRDYEKHVKLQNEWGTDIGLTLYREKAINLLSRRDASVELYYQKGYDTLVVYDRTSEEFVSATINGDIVTFFKPKPGYVDNILSGNLIRIN